MEKISYKISIASDQRGIDTKSQIIKQLKSLKHIVKDLGPNDSESVDYPDYAHKVTSDITDGFSDFGILICGTGIGMSIAANRNSDIRAALCITEKMSSLARAHNNANILVIGANITNPLEIKKILTAFLSTSFEGGRHAQRLSKIR